MIPIFSAAVTNAGLDLSGAISRVLDRHWYVLGDEVRSFESEFARYLGVESCVTVANGTDALEIALRAVGVGAGDKVVTVANAGFYASTAILALGGVPLYIDVDEKTLTMAPACFERVLSENPRAVIVTHLYGQMAEIDALVDLARGAGVPIIEDCAQAHGARRNGRLAGSFGDAACFSFYPTKNLGALGDAGAVVTNDAQLAERLRTLRQYGWSSKYCVETAGGRNSRLDEMQAAVLREKLPHLDRWNAERRSIANTYNKAFAALPVLALPSDDQDSVAHLYVMRVKERDGFREFLRERGIGTDVHYPIPDHLQPAYPDPSVSGDLLVTEGASRTVVSLPCFPCLSEQEVDLVIAAVHAYFH